MIAEMNTEELVNTLLLASAARKNRNQARDEFIFLNREFLSVTEEMIPAVTYHTLLYLHDLARKGYYEVLKVKANGSSGYFTKLEKLIGGGKDDFYDCISCLFLAYYYTVGSTDIAKAEQFAERSVRAAESLYTLNKTSFFYLVKKFSELYKVKIALRSGREDSVETLFEAWNGLIRDRVNSDKEEVGGSGFDMLLYRAFNDLYALSLLSPSFGRIFREKMPASLELLSRKVGPGFLSSFVKVRWFLEEDRSADALLEFTGMVAQYKRSEESSMLIAAFAEINGRLKEKGDPVQPALAEAGKKYFLKEVPKYMLESCFG